MSRQGSETQACMAMDGHVFGRAGTCCSTCHQLPSGQVYSNFATRLLDSRKPAGLNIAGCVHEWFPTWEATCVGLEFGEKVVQGSLEVSTTSRKRVKLDDIPDYSPVGSVLLK
jgi:hypothetical protein